MAAGVHGVIGHRLHLGWQFLARRGQPLLVASGQDDLGVVRQGERSEDGQADLAGAAEKEDPGRGTRPVRENFHVSNRSVHRPATNRASQHASQASIGPSLVSRSSTGAKTSRQPVIAVSDDESPRSVARSGATRCLECADASRFACARHGVNR